MTTDFEQYDLYQAILKRRSVRRYAKQPLTEALLERVRGLVETVQPLVEENRFTVLLRDIASGDDLVKALGAYGRFLSPPHLMLPYMVGTSHVLADLGYRTQQLILRMTLLGIGTGYIGGLGRETTLRARFVLRRAARIGMVVTYGRPATALGGRAINAVMRTAVRSDRRLQVEKIFFHKSFNKPAKPPETLAPLITAARHAPSAFSVQPWRLLWRNAQLYLFVTRENARYGKGIKQEYRLVDAGACMGNMTLALEALGQAGRWVWLEEGVRGMPKYPAKLEPIAKLILEEA